MVTSLCLILCPPFPAVPFVPSVLLLSDGANDINPMSAQNVCCQLFDLEMSLHLSLPQQVLS